MSNLSFEEGLIRDHTGSEPLEGYSVVLFGRLGEAGEKFRRVLGPGVPLPKERNPFKRMFGSTEYVAFAVSAAPELRLEFRERMVSAEHMHELDLVFNLYYAVAEPRVVARLRANDPLRQVRDRVAQLVSYEMAGQPWETVLNDFASTAEEVVLGVLGELRAFARDFGIALRSVRVSSRLEQADADAAVAYRRERDRKRRELAEEELDTAVQLKGIRARVLESKGDAAVQVIGTLAGNVQTVQEASKALESGTDVLYSVWYATNRRQSQRGNKVGYGVKLDTRVHTGRCDVIIPASHCMGELGSPWLRRLWSGVDDRLRLYAVKPLESESFWNDIRLVSGRFAPEERNALVFIHGYRVSFKDAALRTAQLGYDLGIKGPVAFFSWPSRASLAGYIADGSAVEASERSITEFLIQFAQDSGCDRVHVIAHSMGNRPLLRALQRILSAAEDRPGVRFGHLILAAPDITRELFLDVADQYRRLSLRTTLYVSDVDRALRASFRLQGARVGLVPPVTCVSGIDTIHVANVDRTMMGHSTFAEAPRLIYDMHSLINHDLPPEQRAGLIERQEGVDRYWEVRR